MKNKYALYAIAILAIFTMTMPVFACHPAPGEIILVFRNHIDLITISKVFGTTPASPNWNSKADLNNDSVVNILDLILSATHLGDKPAENLHIVVVGEADLFGNEDLWIGYTGVDGIARFTIYLHPDLTYNVYTTTGKIVSTEPITRVDQILNLGSFLVSDDGSAYAILWIP